jgi:hypothetical protein
MPIELIADNESALSVRTKLNSLITKINETTQLDTENLITNGLIIFDGTKFKTTNFLIENGVLTFNNYNTTGKTLTITDNTLTVPFDGNTYAVIVNDSITTVTLQLPEVPYCSVVSVNFIYSGSSRVIPTSALINWPSGVLPTLQTNTNEIINLILWNDQFGNIFGECVIRKIAV